jgi:dTDP-4-dehydrorhamnose 3,5-epimerase
MNVTPLALSGAALIEPDRRRDERGWFARVYCEHEFAAHGLPHRMVQTNRSVTLRAGTLRGLHYQLAPHAEDKLVRCEHGAIWDVIVDLRPDSSTYCRWFGAELSEDNGRMMLVPRGFAHGFVTLTDNVAVSYQVSNFYAPQAERGARYDDEAFGIAWPIPILQLSHKDASWPTHRTQMENA